MIGFEPWTAAIPTNHSTTILLQVFLKQNVAFPASFSLFFRIFNTVFNKVDIK